MSIIKYYGKPLKNLTEEDLRDAFKGVLRDDLYGFGVSTDVKRDTLQQIFDEAMSRISKGEKGDE